MADSAEEKQLYFQFKNILDQLHSSTISIFPKWFCLIYFFEEMHLLLIH